MDVALERLQRLNIARKCEIWWWDGGGKEEKAAKIPVPNKTSKIAAAAADMVSIDGYIVAHFNLSSAANDYYPDIDGIHLATCRILSKPNEKVQFYHEEKKDTILQDLPSIRIKFRIKKSENNVNTVRLEITGIGAPWLPKKQRVFLQNKLRLVLTRTVACKMTDFSAIFESLLDYVERCALYELFSIQRRGGRGDADENASRYLTLMLISRFRETAFKKLCKSQPNKPLTVDGKNALTMLIGNERNVLLCEPWKTRGMIIKFVAKDKARDAHNYAPGPIVFPPPPPRPPNQQPKRQPKQQPKQQPRPKQERLKKQPAPVKVEQQRPPSGKVQNLTAGFKLLDIKQEPIAAGPSNPQPARTFPIQKPAAAAPIAVAGIEAAVPFVSVPQLRLTNRPAVRAAPVIFDAFSVPARAYLAQTAGKGLAPALPIRPTDDAAPAAGLDAVAYHGRFAALQNSVRRIREAFGAVPDNAAAAAAPIRTVAGGAGSSAAQVAVKTDAIKRFEYAARTRVVEPAFVAPAAAAGAAAVARAAAAADVNFRAAPGAAVAAAAAALVAAKDAANPIAVQQRKNIVIDVSSASSSASSVVQIPKSAVNAAAARASTPADRNIAANPNKSRRIYQARRSPQAAKKSCLICTDDKPLTDFYRLTKCAHLFCRECLRKSITIAVDENSVKSAKCLAFECKQLIEYGDVQKLLLPEKFAKYDQLLLELEIAAMDDVEICPNQACGAQYVIDAARLAREHHTTAQCPHCQQVQCLMCKQIRRAGEVQHVCAVNGSHIQQVLDTYESSSTTVQARARLEQVYGKQKLQNMCDNRRSEREVQAKKKCPQCKSPCVKEEGCNKVTCTKCGTIWCWLCAYKIPAGEGYAHFNQVVVNGQVRPCTGRLWEGVPGVANAAAAGGAGGVAALMAQAEDVQRQVAAMRDGMELPRGVRFHNRRMPIPRYRQ